VLTEEKAIYTRVWNTCVSQNARNATEDYFSNADKIIEICSYIGSQSLY
jgi:hypothetical protein